jgi:hypothetical protein
VSGPGRHFYRHALTRLVGLAVGVLTDITSKDGTHSYFSTHCRHRNHEACSATAVEGRQLGERVRLPRRPAQCKTCAAPCICPCHKEGT